MSFPDWIVLWLANTQVAAAAVAPVGQCSLAIVRIPLALLNVADAEKQSNNRWAHF